MARQNKIVKAIVMNLRQMVADGVLEREQAEALVDVARRLGHGGVTRNPREIEKAMLDLHKAMHTLADTLLKP